MRAIKMKARKKGPKRLEKVHDGSVWHVHGNPKNISKPHKQKSFWNNANYFDTKKHTWKYCKSPILQISEKWYSCITTCNLKSRNEIFRSGPLFSSKNGPLNDTSLLLFTHSNELASQENNRHTIWNNAPTRHIYTILLFQFEYFATKWATKITAKGLGAVGQQSSVRLGRPLAGFGYELRNQRSKTCTSLKWVCEMWLCILRSGMHGLPLSCREMYYQPELQLQPELNYWPSNPNWGFQVFPMQNTFHIFAPTNSTMKPINQRLNKVCKWS